MTNERAVSVTGALVRAAQVLERFADELKADNHGGWSCQQDLTKYYELILLARALRERHRKDLVGNETATRDVF